MKAIYCYWGNLGDHNLNIPGHPLYQLYFLKVLKKKFNINKFYFFSFLKQKHEKNLNDIIFFIKEKKRQQLLKDLNIEIVNFYDAMKLLKNCDYIFLKARFRNKSRLEEKSYDALKFEKFLENSNLNRVYIIDSDGELPKDFFIKWPTKIITYFYKAKKFYQESNYKIEPIEIISLPCALREDFEEYKPKLNNKNYDLFFIGNYGLKQKILHEYLEQLSRDGLKIAVQGKWPQRFDFKIYHRYERNKAYREFEKSLSTIQISKEKYRKYSFLSPRIYEAAAVGINCFIEKGYICSTKFLEIDSYIDLREKLKCLRDGYERDYFLIRDELYSKLYEIEKRLL